MTIELPYASPSLRAKATAQGIDLKAQAKAQPDGFARQLGPTGQPAPKIASVPHRDQLGPGQAIPRSKIDKLTADNLSASQRLPTVTHQDAVDHQAIDQLRRTLYETTGNKLSALSIQVMALAQTLRAYPHFNASLTDNGESLWLKDDIHIGIAVDTADGLMVPVLKHADQLGLKQIGESISDLAARARARQLRPEQMQGAGMSVSNLGGLGGRSFNPMINPPEVAILGVMQTRIEPIWDGEAFIPTPMCPLALSYDHRVINGAEAQRFLNHLKALLADPRQLLR